MIETRYLIAPFIFERDIYGNSAINRVNRTQKITPVCMCIYGACIFSLSLRGKLKYLSTNMVPHTRNSDANAYTLQIDMGNLKKWVRNWLMEFYPINCHVMNITHKYKITSFLCHIRDHPPDTEP